MLCFDDNIKINIFKYVNYPLNLALTCQNWSAIVKDPQAKSEWLIERYGKNSALYHAVRLGPTFIDITVCQALIAKKVLISSSFIQSLLKCFEKNDQNELEMKYNIGQSDLSANRIHVLQQENKSSLANNLPTAVLSYLLDEGTKQLSNDDNLPPKSVEMDSSHLLPAGPHALVHTGIPRKDLKEIKDIRDSKDNKRFAPFFPKSTVDLNSESHNYRPSHQSKDSYESFRKGSSIRKINQRRKDRFERQRKNRFANTDTLNRIARLPRQVTNIPFANHLFNGASFA